MKHKKTGAQHCAPKLDLDLRIPEGPVPIPQAGSFELRSGGGQHSFQVYAEHCLNDQGGEPSLEAFKTNFTTWSLEGAGGVILFPEGPAFQVLNRHFMEGDEPLVYHASAAHYTALMLCLHPTIFPSAGSTTAPPGEQYASYRVSASWEPDGPSNFSFVPQKPIATSGEIFTWKHNYHPQKVSLRIEVFPSPTGRNNIYLGGRLGTYHPPSETM